jgi:Flp pilus assembly protein protease CpaA
MQNHDYLPLLVLAVIVLVALYDQRTKRIPNWVSLPLLAAGMLAHFPGRIETWLSCVLLFLGWRFGGIGAGDAKLLMALLWVVPGKQADAAAYVMWISYFITSLAEIFWRKVTGKKVFGVRSPAAWRAIPFGLWLLFF